MTASPKPDRCVMPAETDLHANENLTELIHGSRRGDSEASRQLYNFVYDKLKSTARRNRRRWGFDAPLDTTSLVHEFFEKYSKANQLDCEDRQHFFNLAARMMHQILLNSASRKTAKKRGGTARPVDYSEEMLVDVRSPESLILVDQLMRQLAESSPAAARAFACRRFASMTNDETAEAMGVSVSTVKRQLEFANAWLKRAMLPDEEPPSR